MPEFVHLHNHTHYSLLDGACSIDGLIQAAGENNMSAVGLTDHGVNFGLLEFYQKAKKAGIKPIMGCEVYVADGDRFDKSSLKSDGKQRRRNYFHLILLAKNYDGYRTLNRLTSRAHTEGFYYKPRIDRQLLQENHEGLICLSACAGGVVSAHLVNENMDAAREAAIWYRELFGEDFYLEIQDHGIPVDKPVLEGMPMLAKELNIPLVGTNDCHYIRKEHAIAHNVLLHIRDASGKGVDVNVEEELRYGTTNYYFKSAQEMADLFRLYPEAIERSVEIAEKCDVKIPTELYMPNFPIPQTSQAGNLDEYLTELTYQGTERRYHNIPLDVKERVDFELDVIIRMGYSGYFLIVQDFIQAARDRGVRVGPGRGSAAGSLVAYALGITDIDPLKYDLLFERFLNPDRVSMPDIDVDFADDKREMVIEYVKQKYGEEAVSQIITFSTLSSRAVLKDVGRVLGIPHTTINEITKDIQVKFGRVQPLAEAIENAELRWVKESSDLKIKKLIDYSLVLEGFCRAASTHAAGVVIAPGPLEDYIPLYKTPTTGLASQYTMKYLEDAGLLKMDFLGLRTLTIIEETLSLIKQRHGLELDIDAVPLDDPKTYEMLGKGLTTAVFQFESPPMQKYLKQLKPERLEDLIAMNALYRPGPMDNIPDFIDRKHGRKEIAYLHEKLEPILGKTYGICVYQEQIMQIAQQLGGFTLAQADTLRRAMGKKQIQYMEEMKGTYFEGCKEQGIERKTADEIWDMMVKFADYGFNKCLPGDVEVIDAATGKPVRIEELYVNGIENFSTVTCRTDSLQLQSGAVSQVMFNGIKPVYRLRTRSGREIEATDNHPFYTYEGWKRLDQLQPGGMIAVPRSLPVEGSAEWPDHEVIVLGHLLAEGNLCHPASVYFYTQDNEQLADYVRAVEAFPNVRCSMAMHRSTWSVYAKRIEKGREAGVVTWAKDLGIWGKNALCKEIPSEAFTLGSRQIGLLLSRMWEGDGHIDTAGRSLFYATSSKRMAHQVQHLLLRLGVLSRIRTVDFPYRESLRRGYQIFVTGAEQIERFSLTVGAHFVSARRKELLQAILEEASDTYAVIDVVPVQAREHVRDIKQRTGLTWKGFESLTGVSSRDFYPTGTNPAKRGFTRKIFGRLNETLDSPDIRRLAENDIYWDEVVSIEYQGEKPTYDLEVPGTHNFIANDILVHNSHSAAYAYVAYQTAYLKANYAAEFLAANMTNESSDQTKVVKLIDECRAFGVEVLPPNINQSMVNFSVDKQGEIVFGMAGIRNVGASAVSAILEERKRAGKFTSIFDFTKRLAGNNLINRRLLEHLVLAGAFDTIHNNRRQCFEALDSAMGYGGAWAAQRASGMDSLFAVEGLGEEAMIPEPALPDVPEWPQMEKLKREKEVLDFYVSGHPLEAYRLEAETFSEIRFGELPEELDTTKPVRICGVVASVRTKLDRRENQFAIVGVEDFTGKAECVFWSDAWRRNAAMVTEGAMIFVVGRPEIEGADKLRIIADDVIPVNDSLQKFTKGVAVNVRLDDVAEDAPQQTEQLFREHQGEVQCMFRVYDTQGALVGRWTARKMMIAPSRGLIDGLGKIYSPQNVKIVG